MDLAFTDEQQDLRATVRRFLADTSGIDVVRRLADTSDSSEGFDRGTWGRMASEIGVAALPVPERFDGLGQTAVETAVVCEEMGRVLYPGPLLATLATTHALLLAGDEAACAELLPGIAAGETIGTLALADGRWTTLSATGAGELTGSVLFVLDGCAADLLLVPAATPDGPSLFAVEGDAAGLSRTPQESLDLTRRVARLDLDATPARRVGEPGGADAVLADVRDRVLVAVAAEQAGGAAACLEMSVDHAKNRTQFGRPIGAFQAVAHACVDMLHAVEFSRASAHYAAATQAAGSPEAPVAARVAAAYCGRAFREVATETIQVHGGTGFTWEHDAHLYYRRAWSSEQLFGGAETHWAELADRIGLPG